MSILHELHQTQDEEVLRSVAHQATSQTYGLSGWWMAAGLLSLWSVSIGFLLIIAAAFATVWSALSHRPVPLASVMGILPRSLDAVLRPSLRQWMKRHWMLTALFLLFWIAPLLILSVVGLAFMSGQQMGPAAFFLAVLGIGSGLFFRYNSRARAWVSLTK